MPTYRYECESCGHSMEMMQAMSAAKLTQCPSCGEDTLQRLIGTGGGLIFRGTGFYETDYKSKPSCPAAASCPAAETKKDGCGCGSGCSHTS